MILIKYGTDRTGVTNSLKKQTTLTKQILTLLVGEIPKSFS
jgi:hypothetical protein